MPTVSRRELSLAILWSLLIVLITSGPYIVGQLEANGRYFSGLVSAVDDGNAYLQWIRQASEGSWTFHNQYSAEESPGRWLNVYFLALGRTARWLHLRPPQVFSAARVLSGCLCLVALFMLASALSPSPAFRWTALLLVSLSSGFGWLVEMLGPGVIPYQPIDYSPRWLYQPEAITFVSILVNPLFAFSMALMCLSLLCALRCADTGRLRWALAGGLCLMLLGNVHTYDLPVVHLTILVWLVIVVATKRLPLLRAALMYGIMLVMTLPSGLWQWHVMQTDPVYRARADTPTLSQPYIDYVLGHGVPWLLALVAVGWLAFAKSMERRRLAYLIPWAVIASVVIYLPVPWQRKMAEGLHFPICLLAAVTLAIALGDRLARGQLSAQARHVRLFALTAFVVLIAMPSNVMFYSDCLHHVRTNNADLGHVMMPPVYLQPGEYAAMRELAAKGTDRDVVLSSSMMGNHIPALTPCRVVAGHWGESVYVLPVAGGGWQRHPFESYAMPATLRFFSPTSTDVEKAATLLAFNVTYVFCGPVENTLYAARTSAPAEGMADRALSGLPFLQKVYSQDGVSLFRVAPSTEVMGSLRGQVTGRRG
ncbi:MAG: hypothetical protein FJX75_27040 [Armatimonadetes bacterium]|nr:hypothetical protein [Armatimonadota bacterium]